MPSAHSPLKPRVPRTPRWRPPGGPPRLFCPLVARPPGSPNPSALPLMFYMPGIDGTGLAASRQFPSLSAAFDLRCLVIPPGDRLEFEPLVDCVAVGACPPGGGGCKRGGRQLGRENGLGGGFYVLACSYPIPGGCLVSLCGPLCLRVVQLGARRCVGGAA